MRNDLNKLLCERERIGSSNKFRDHRRTKSFTANLIVDGDNVPSREGMKKRYHSGWGTKTFNENLNPLFGAVRKAVGRPWNKFYSELCRTFNMNSVINAHILQHLNSYVEHKDIYVGDDGELHINVKKFCMPVSLKNSYVEYYVDPRDGILKRNKWFKHYKTKNREAAKEAKIKIEKTFREIDKNTILRCIDDTWFMFEVACLPVCKMEYIRPAYRPVSFPINENWSELKWEELTDKEKQKYGILVQEGKVYDVFTRKHVFLHNGHVYGDNGLGKKDARYHVKKQTAPHKLLKKMGIV